MPDAAADSLEGFLARNVARPAAVSTDGWKGYAGLDQAGYDHEPINLSRSWGDAALRLPGIHLIFGLAKRWLLGTHHGAVSTKHLQAYLDEYVFRFNRRTAKLIYMHLRGTVHNLREISLQRRDRPDASRAIHQNAAANAGGAWDIRGSPGTR